MPGGTFEAIEAARSSLITPAPLGMAVFTTPSASAPASIDIHASCSLAIQQTLMRGNCLACMVAMLFALIR